MSADLSAEISALTLHASASASASGSATPSAARSAAGSPPSAGVEQQSHAHTLSGEEGELEEAAMALAAPDGVKADRRHGRSGRQLDVNERRTIFIPNLPRDATLREVSNARGAGLEAVWGAVRAAGSQRVSATSSPFLCLLFGLFLSFFACALTFS